MTLQILSTVKNLIFMNLTNVEFSKFLIFLMTSSITIGIITLTNQIKHKYKGIIAFIFYTIISVIMFLDVTYYRQFGTLPSIAMFGQVNQLVAVEDTIRNLVDIKSLTLVLDIPVLILVYFLKDKDLEKHTLSKKNTKNINAHNCCNIYFIHIIWKYIWENEFSLFSGTVFFP